MHCVDQGQMQGQVPITLLAASWNGEVDFKSAVKPFQKSIILGVQHSSLNLSNAQPQAGLAEHSSLAVPPKQQNISLTEHSAVVEHCGRIRLWTLSEVIQSHKDVAVPLVSGGKRAPDVHSHTLHRCPHLVLLQWGMGAPGHCLLGCAGVALVGLPGW